MKHNFYQAPVKINISFIIFKNVKCAEPVIELTNEMDQWVDQLNGIGLIDSIHD